MSRVDQFRAAFEATRQSDDRLLAWMGGMAVVGALVGVLIGQLLLGSLIVAVLLGILLGLLAGLFTFGRRAEKAQFRQIEGQPGAAAAVVQSLRGQWWVTPAIAFTRKQDLVHLVVGRPGVVLVGEGGRSRVAGMLEQEAKKMERLAGDVSIHTINVGPEDGQVTLAKLRMRMLKLKGELSKTEVPDLARKLEAIAQKQQPQMPKGPMPRAPRRMR